MKRLLVLVFLWCGLSGTVNAYDEGDMFTIYLARHAEKESAAEDPRDPLLTPCGGRRAESLATLMKDVNLKHVYSTDYLRTRNTALPAASGHGLEVEFYDPRNLEGFAAALLAARQNSLVIGHSDTTAVLAGLLAGEVGEEFAEDEYSRLYLVTVSGDARQMILLDQAFNCQQ